MPLGDQLQLEGVVDSGVTTVIPHRDHEGLPGLNCAAEYLSGRGLSIHLDDRVAAQNNGGY